MVDYDKIKEFLFNNEYFIVDIANIIKDYAFEERMINYDPEIQDFVRNIYVNCEIYQPHTFTVYAVSYNVLKYESGCYGFPIL